MSLVRKGSEIQPPKSPRCVRCFKPIREDGHKGFCSSDCMQAASEEVSQATLRKQVFERDHGVCASCGIDTESVRTRVELLRIEAQRRPTSIAFAMQAVQVHQLVRLGFPRGPVERGESLWACDHRVERVAGGASNLAQAQTLCLSCHAKKTSGFASSRAASRKTSKDARLSGKRRRFGR